nr:ubiquitin-like domain-containing protein CIP73 [Ipomoea batatas]
MDKNGSDENNDAIEIKIKTMFCHQTQTLRVDKRVGVGALKEEVTLVTGVLAEHQRLIFRGKALSDDKQLSDYHVEDGDTLHLIVTTTSHLSEQLSLITQMVSTLLLSIAHAAANVESQNALLLSIAPPSTSLSAAEAALERELHRAAIMDIYAMLGVRGLDAHRRAARSIRELRRASRPIRERRRASRWIRDTRHAASLSVRNRGSSSSSRDQPAPAASLMNVSNSIEETNAVADAAEDRSKDDGGSPDV